MSLFPPASWTQDGSPSASSWKVSWSIAAVAPCDSVRLSFVVIWLRVAYPRLREDQLQRLAWLGLVPVALAQLVLTGVVAVVIA